ncbi:ATP-binding protein [Bacteroidota bacterium]
MKKEHLPLLLMGWISIILFSFFLNFYLMKLNTSRLAKNKAESFFSEIVTTRLWNSIHGGVYVPITEQTQPNPYLDVPERDIETIQGKKLTMINPAYMTRQIAELAEKNNDIKYHITSLNPIRPANNADDWETKALKLFEKNPEGIIEKADYDSAAFYRYMAPLVTEESCISCHAGQGYKVGEIRGGISVSFRSDVYHLIEVKQTIALSVIHFVVLFLGIFALKYYYSMSNKYLTELQIKNLRLEEDKVKQAKLNKELFQLNSTKDKLFSIIGHDLRSPINSIIGFSGLLKEKIDQNDFDKIAYLNNHIWNGGIQTSQLIDNISFWANTQKEKIKFNPAQISLKNIFTDLLKTYDSIASLKNITLENNLKSDILIWADIDLLRIILRNLINNAIKFTKKDGSVIIDATELESETRISVKDNGIGISEDSIQLLFSSAKDKSTLGTENEFGTGLGLMLCKEFVERHGGKIWVKSEINKATEFIFSMPHKL